MTDVQRGGLVVGSRVWKEQAGRLGQKWAQTLVPACIGCGRLSVCQPLRWGEQAEPRIQQC